MLQVSNPPGLGCGEKGLVEALGRGVTFGSRYHNPTVLDLLFAWRAWVACEWPASSLASVSVLSRSTVRRKERWVQWHSCHAIPLCTLPIDVTQPVGQETLLVSICPEGTKPRTKNGSCSIEARAKGIIYAFFLKKIIARRWFSEFRTNEVTISMSWVLKTGDIQHYVISKISLSKSYQFMKIYFLKF